MLFNSARSIKRRRPQKKKKQIDPRAAAQPCAHGAPWFRMLEGTGVRTMVFDFDGCQGENTSFARQPILFVWGLLSSNKTYRDPANCSLCCLCDTDFLNMQAGVVQAIQRPRSR